MNVLLETYALLGEAMLGDPFLTLVNAVTWLDPLWQIPEDYEYEEGNEGEIALHITRGIFPEIYVGAVEQIRTGITFAQLDKYVCREISKRGIPLDSLEYLAYGIPLPAHGVDLTEAALYSARPDVARLLALFGVGPEQEAYHVEVPNRVYILGRILAYSLVKQKEACWQQVGWALAWLFSCSGNTLIDCHDDALAEMPPLPWDIESVEFAVALIEEADGVLKDVDAGLTMLAAHAAALHILTQNVNRAIEKLARVTEKNREPTIRLAWPPLDRGADGAALTGAQLLQFRGDASEA